jgi:hypothetical protein
MGDCDNIPLAIIYLQNESGIPGSDTLHNDIATLERTIAQYNVGSGDWCSTPDRYIGIFIIDGTNFIPNMEEFAKFHLATDTYQEIKKHPDYHSAFGGGENTTPLLAVLRSNKITHIMVVGLTFETTVAATARDIVRHGFKACIVSKATRALDPKVASEEVLRLKADGITVAETTAEIYAFMSKLPRNPAFGNCPCDLTVPAQRRWCTQKRNTFLWRVCVRLRKAVSEVKSAGWEGSWPPRIVEDTVNPSELYSWSRSGFWKAEPHAVKELCEAIQQANMAGIPTNDATTIHNYCQVLN